MTDHGNDRTEINRAKFEALKRRVRGEEAADGASTSPESMTNDKKLEMLLRKGLDTLTPDEIDLLLSVYSLVECLYVYPKLFAEGFDLNMAAVTTFLANRTQTVRRVVTTPDGDVWTTIQPDSASEQSSNDPEA